MKLLKKSEVMVFAVFVIAMALGPVVGDLFTASIQGYASVIAIFAMSVYLVVAWIGEIPLGHSMYFGFGAYLTAILMKNYETPFWMATIIALCASGVVAALVGLVTLRLRGAYFAIVSWGLASVAVVLVNSWTAVTGGALGFYGTPEAFLFGISLAEPRSYAWICGTLLAVVVVTMAVVRRSKFGRRLNGGRINNNLIRAAGAHIYFDRVLAFAVSAALASLAGSLAISYVHVLTPNLLSFTVTVDALVIVLLGGTGFLLGPIVGTVIIRILPEELSMPPEYRTVVVAALILWLVLIAPGGIPDIINRLTGRKKRQKAPGRQQRGGDAIRDQWP